MMSGYISASVVDVVGGGAKPGGQTGGQQVEVKKPAEGAPTIIVQQQVQQAQANTQTNTQTQANAGNGGSGAGGGGIKIMGGLGLANMSVSFPAGTDPADKALFDKYKQSKMGIAGGIGFAMGSRIGLEFDVLYLQKGVRFKGTDTSSGETITFDMKMNFNMISVPVLLRFNILDSPTGPALYFMGGGEIAYILDAKTDYTYTQAGATQTGSEKIEKENRNSIDYGAVLGAGVGLNLGGMQFFVEGRYHLGMANLFKSATGTDVPDEDYKATSSVILLLAGFKF
jgi:hypothetical protein